MRDQHVSKAIYQTAPKSPALPCTMVALRRARRTASKRHLPKSLTPIITALIFLGLMFNRLKPLGGWLLGNQLTSIDEGGAIIPTPSRSLKGVISTAALSSEPGNGDVRRDKAYHVHVNFGEKHLSQVIAFLMRNKGKNTSAAVEEKWKYLDRHALHLAVYLRSIEANANWALLEQEVRGFSGIASTRRNRKSSGRDGSILPLVPEWSRRGQNLLAGITEPDGEITYSNPSSEDEPTPPTPVA